MAHSPVPYLDSVMRRIHVDKRRVAEHVGSYMDRTGGIRSPVDTMTMRELGKDATLKARDQQERDQPGLGG